MADNVTVDNGTLTDYTVASDEDADGQHQYVKLEYGADGTFTKVAAGASALPIQDGGNSITVDGTITSTPSVVGGGTEATAQRVTIASDSTGLVSVDDNGGSLTVDNAALAVTGGGAEATALRVTVASDSTGVLSIDDNGGSITVDGTVTAADEGTATIRQGKATVVSGSVSVTTTSGEAVASRTGRAQLTLMAAITNSADIDVGPSGVASGSGFPLAPGASLTLRTTGAIHADAASGTQTLKYIEIY